MKPEEIVVSLEMAKKLKDAGWSLEWSWMFREGYMLGDDGEPQSWILTHGHKPEIKSNYVLPAPTASELFEELYEYTEVQKFSIGYRASLPHLAEEHGALGYSLEVLYDTPQDALAAMYCYLAENKLLN